MLLETKELVVLILLWQIIGTVICFSWACAVAVEVLWELCNPYYAYRHYNNVNRFGACFISLLYTVLSPVGALIYWFYILCTFGRKSN